MSDPVSVPLSRLRVMPPQGAPVVHPKYGRGVILDPSDAECPAIFERTAKTLWSRQDLRDAPGLALDLSAPTTARIDGATVAATLLAEAVGLDVSRGVCWSADRDDPFDKGRGAVVIRAATGSAIRRYSEPTDATNPRAILAAVLVAVLGVTP